MDLYGFALENKEILKLVYALIIVLVCVVIVFKTNKLFRLSSHNGIRYFRNAFFFYGVGFVVRYVLGSKMIFPIFPFSVIGVLFEFFFVMAGFFLIYSLMWKKFESPETDYTSSLFNSKIFIFYVLALLIVVLDSLWSTNTFMFFSQIIVFAFNSFISYSNHKKRKGKPFLRFYFLAMLLAFFAWALNAVAEIYFNWNQAIIINIYILNLVFFLLFLFGVSKIIKPS